MWNDSQLDVTNRIFTHSCELVVGWRMQLMTTSPLQMLPCRRCSLDWSLITFSLSFYTTFSHPDPLLKPCGYSTFLIMIQNVPFSPNLYNTACQFYVMIYMTFDWQANWPFLLQVDVAGDGSKKTNIKMKTKWLFNTSHSHPTSTPPHASFT